MKSYLIKRVLLFFPTLLIISFLSFFISVKAPGDPVALLLNLDLSTGTPFSGDVKKKYLELNHKLGLDLPLFYFSISPKCISDTLFKITNKEDKEYLEKLAYEYGNWNTASNYFRHYKLVEEFINTSNSKNISSLKTEILSIKSAPGDSEVIEFLKKLKFVSQADTNNSFRESVTSLENAFSNLISNKNAVAKYIPVFYWHGYNNQYHKWLFGDKAWFGNKNDFYTSEGILRGDFGISYIDQRPVSGIIWEALKWTLTLISIALIISFGVSIPLGMYSAFMQGSRTEKWITGVLFILYSLPNFWVATLLITFLANAEYLELFPAYGLGELSASASFLERFLETTHHFILPVICLTYASLAVISRQMRTSVLNTLSKEFIKTARSKGLNEQKILWKHAFKNSLFPIITLITEVFPWIVGGSLVIEIIFSIPGMGKLSYEALLSKNYPLIFSIILLSSSLTLFGNLIGDVMYAVLDPRVKFHKSE